MRIESAGWAVVLALLGFLAVMRTWSRGLIGVVVAGMICMKLVGYHRCMEVTRYEFKMEELCQGKMKFGI